MQIIDRKALDTGRITGILPVRGGTGLPVWILCGASDGPTLVLTAGVHGCEYVGIVTLRQLFARLSPAQIRGRVILLPLVNGEGFYAGSKQVVPSDGKNINRVFPPPAEGTMAQEIARTVVEQIYPNADFLLDLHGGDVNEAMTHLVFYPATAAPDVTAQAKAAAQHLEVMYRIPSTVQNGLYSYAAQCGIPALLMEVGGMGLWTEKQVEMELRSIQSLMGYLDMGPAPVKNIRQKETMEMCYAEADFSGLWFPEVKPERLISAGQMLGRIEDLEGHILQTVHARWDGIVLYHTVSLGVAAEDALLAYGKIEE